MKQSLRYNPITQHLVYYPLFWLGYAAFRATGRTPKLSYLSFRRLYGMTQGRLNQRVSESIRRPAPTLDAREGLLGSGEALESELGAALESLRRDGFYVFRNKLSESMIEELKGFSETTPARLVPPPPGDSPHQTFDPENPRAPRYQFSEQQMLADVAVQRLLADPTLIELAGRYLGTVPINDLFTMWWSAPHGDGPSSAAAQLFHFDMDRFRFLKFFFYLTDVDHDTGPHVYVRGTHRERPAGFFEDRRFSDAEVEDQFGAGEIEEIVGERGTILAVDTSGLHKGLALRTGRRLLCQIEFTNSLFGQDYGRLELPENVLPELEELVAGQPEVFQRFSTT